jgi:hypothetical protein
MLPLKAALLFSGKVLFFLKGRVFIITVILKILLLLMTDHFSISEPLKDLEQAALMPIDITDRAACGYREPRTFIKVRPVPVGPLRFSA